MQRIYAPLSKDEKIQYAIQHFSVIQKNKSLTDRVMLRKAINSLRKNGRKLPLGNIPTPQFRRIFAKYQRNVKTMGKKQALFTALASGRNRSNAVDSQ